MKTLRIGNRGPETKVLQEKLNALGFRCATDGIFGPKTGAALKAFQDSEWLIPDGVAGPQTWAALEQPGRIKHFEKKEFVCPHCGKLAPQGIDRRLLLMLEELRRQIGGRPITVTSGYRCPIHNKTARGAKNSQHLYGRAADIRVNGMSPRELEKYADKLFANDGVGLGGATIVHVDTRGFRARWRYN